VFEFIADNARSKVNGWAEKNLSYPGKEALIKSVIQSMSTYSMSCFLLSKGSCQKLNSISGRFWWGGNLDRRSMHWLSWEKLSVPKSNGGMGFRDMHMFNIALLGKQVWRLLTNPTSLCSQVLLGRYCHNTNLMEASAPKTASKTWRAILAGREAVELGMIKRVGSGESISIWNDNWIPKLHSMRPMGRRRDTDMEKVSELITNDHKWNTDVIEDLFFAPDAEAIKKIPLRSSWGDDSIAW
jgi:hypothetical protein